MNINVSIVDQRVNKIMEAISETVRETLNINDEISIRLIDGKAKAKVIDIKEWYTYE